MKAIERLVTALEKFEQSDAHRLRITITVQHGEAVRTATPEIVADIKRATCAARIETLDHHPKRVTSRGEKRVRLVDIVAQMKHAAPSRLIARVLRDHKVKISYSGGYAHALENDGLRNFVGAASPSQTRRVARQPVR